MITGMTVGCMMQCPHSGDLYQVLDWNIQKDKILYQEIRSGKIALWRMAGLKQNMNLFRVLIIVGDKNT